MEEDPRGETRDTLAGAIESLRQSARVWNRELIAHAGVVLLISHDGEAYATLGVVRQSDEKTVKAIRKQLATDDATGDEAMGTSEISSEEAAPIESGLPKRLIRELLQVRTRAIRVLLARDRETALAVTVAAMIAHSVFKSELPGIGVTAHSAHVDDLDTLVETRSAILAHVPDEQDELLDWCLIQPPETLLSLLAVVVAGSVDLVHEKGSLADHRRHALADRLSSVLDLDMRQFWEADAAYWTRLPKADLLAALAEEPVSVSRSEQTREGVIKAYAKLKKDDLAAKVGQTFAGVGYLPNLLVTPGRSGAADVALSVSLVAAE